MPCFLLFFLLAVVNVASGDVLLLVRVRMSKHMLAPTGPVIITISGPLLPMRTKYLTKSNLVPFEIKDTEYSQNGIDKNDENSIIITIREEGKNDILARRHVKLPAVGGVIREEFYVSLSRPYITLLACCSLMAAFVAIICRRLRGRCRYLGVLYPRDTEETFMLDDGDDYMIKKGSSKKGMSAEEIVALVYGSKRTTPIVLKGGQRPPFGPNGDCRSRCRGYYYYYRR